MDGDERQVSRSWKRASHLAASTALIAAFSFGGGYVLGSGENGGLGNSLPLIGDSLSTVPDTSANLNPFWKAWNVLNERFVNTHASTSLPDTKEKLWGAIAGLAASYDDPYTVFLPPSDAKIFQEDILGTFSGVGMAVGVKEGILTVIAPLKDSPAERAGIRAGDLVLSIDDMSTEGMSTDEAVKLIRGPKGTTVSFILLRNKERKDLSVVRDNINVPTIDYSLDKERGVYSIALYSFTATSNGLFNRALTAFRESGSDKLIIDLRGNPGGYLSSAVDIASYFLAKDEIVVVEDYQGKEENVIHKSTGVKSVPSSVKVAILIDQGSASASEILAGALQDHEVATLIGTRSFGKGSVQELVAVDGGSLKITVARWLTPNGTSISDGGLTPNIEVKYTEEDLKAGKDPQKARAVEFLTTGK